MAGRSKKNLALSYAYFEVFEETIASLHECTSLFKHIKIGAKATWKPIQTGVLISTMSAIELQHTYHVKRKQFPIFPIRTTYAGCLGKFVFVCSFKESKSLKRS